MMLKFWVNKSIENECSPGSRPANHIKTITLSAPAYVLIIIFIVTMLSGCFDQDSKSKTTVKKQITEAPKTAKQQCVTLNRGSTITIGRKKDLADDVVREKPGNLFRPMTEKEIKLLLTTLKPVKLKKGGGFKISGKPNKLSKERVQVLMQDVIATLARIHLGETMHRISNIPNPDKNTIVWAGGVAKEMDICALDRYQGFGIDPSIILEEVTLIVTALRPELEEVVLGNIFPKEPSGAGTLPPGIEPP
jgi:hypothetical protein